MPRSLLGAATRLATATLVLLGIGAPLRAQAADSVAVLAAVERLFDAMARRDTAAARALMAPGSRLLSMGGDSAGATPRVQSDTAFLRFLAVGNERLLERVWSPTIQLRGPLATVWAPYDFHIDGRRTHCGVDAFTLVRTGSVWRIAGIAYTVERRNCPASPLGPPRS
jgi:hypothetical protein